MALYISILLNLLTQQGHGRIDPIQAGEVKQPLKVSDHSQQHLEGHTLAQDKKKMTIVTE